MLGHFISLSRIACRYDRPLPQSSSRVCREKPALSRITSDREVSVADLGRNTPLIPGQQLYGCMIPRPEYDEKIHQFEKLAAEKKLRFFKDCVGRMNDVNGLSEFERKQLIKLDTLVGTPMSIGYEVVPLEPFTSLSMDTDSTEDMKCGSGRPYSYHSVSVRLMSDKLEYIDSREATHLILESDGKSMYCVSEAKEEGTEVVGTGRFYSPCNNFPEDEESSKSISSNLLHATDHGLSCGYVVLTNRANKRYHTT